MKINDLKVGDVLITRYDEYDRKYISIDVIIDVEPVKEGNNFIKSNYWIYYLNSKRFDKREYVTFFEDECIFLNDYLENPKNYQYYYEWNEYIEKLLKFYFEDNVVEARKYKLKMLGNL